MRKWAVAVAFMVAACALVWLAVRLLGGLFGWHTGWVVPVGMAPWLLIVGRMVAHQVLSSAAHSPGGRRRLWAGSDK
ncbi:hypothetical protein SAMN05414137_107159 [Streptacidiphilus jiangxiensis]|uniref:Uncharacterized protein n=2 Tax=Streptacidiphilus jiangxiensis TaxID=235985 RepID=A0A1H7P0P9_STRJI|nr:hypothetical protein SAMN05414137_107159 [Streptacidiphilus jiangxiensis]